jgi:hypothetical protein
MRSILAAGREGAGAVKYLKGLRNRKAEIMKKSYIQKLRAYLEMQ